MQNIRVDTPPPITKGAFGYTPLFSTKQILRRFINGQPEQITTTNIINYPDEVNLVIRNPMFLIGGIQQPYDQQNLGSCVANAFAFCIVYSAIKNKFIPFMPSRLDMYYNMRVVANNLYGKEITEDVGVPTMYLCEAILENTGVLTEEAWKYDDNSKHETYYTPPVDTLNDERTKIADGKMYTVDNTIPELKSTLANGYIIIFGYYGSASQLHSDKVAYTGIVDKPQTPIPNDDLIGHAGVIVGYTNDGYFLVRNTWGVNWGLGYYHEKSQRINYDKYGGRMRGYYKMSAEYITSELAFEFYVVTDISSTLRTIQSSSKVSLVPNYVTPLERTLYPPQTNNYTKIVYLSQILDKLKVYTFEISYINPSFNSAVHVWFATTRLKNVPITIFNIDALTGQSVENVKVKFLANSVISDVYSNGASILIYCCDKMIQAINIDPISKRLNFI